MKKLILLLFIPLVFACSSDSIDVTNLNNDDTPKVISFTRERSGCELITSTHNLVYENNRVVSGESRGGKYILTGECSDEDWFVYSFTVQYENDKIASIYSIYEIENGQVSNKSRTDNFQYNNLGLISSKETIVYENENITIYSFHQYEWENNNLTMNVYQQDGVNTDILHLNQINNYDSNFNMLTQVNAPNTEYEFTVTRQINYDVLLPVFPVGLYGSISYAQNGLISQSQSNEDSIDFYNYEINENGYPNSVTRTVSDNPDFYSITSYYYD